MVAALVALVVVAFPSGAAAQETGTVRGRVVDQESGEPVQGFLVSIEGAETVLTNATGTFVFLTVPVGERQMTLEHIAYGRHSRSVLVQARVELALEVAVSTQAIELSPLLVVTRSELEQRRVSSGHVLNEINFAEIDAAARSGLNLSQLLQNRMPGVLVRPGRLGQMCVTYRAIRSDNNLGDCDGVSVILDGVPVADPSYIYTSIPLRDIERLEMLSPGQAGVRYGMRTGQSVLLVETQRARPVRQNDLSTLMTGFDWTGEQEPYPWLQVFGSSFVANALGLGIGLVLADRCLSTPEASTLALRTRCRGLATAGASILPIALPALGGSVAARWAGQTERSRGRIFPSMVTSGMILTGGYLLLISGDGASQTAGTVVLSIGVPVVLTLSDRIFRKLR